MFLMPRCWPASTLQVVVPLISTLMPFPRCAGSVVEPVGFPSSGCLEEIFEHLLGTPAASFTEPARSRTRLFRELPLGPETGRLERPRATFYFLERKDCRPTEGVAAA